MGIITHVSIAALRTKYFDYACSYRIYYKRNYIVFYNVFPEKKKEILNTINEYQLEYKISKYKNDCIILKANEELIFYFKMSEIFKFDKEKFIEGF